MVNYFKPGPGERFLILELLSGGASAALIDRDPDGQTRVAKHWPVFQPVNSLAQLRSLGLAPRIVAVADRSMACTVFLPLEIIRESGREPVSRIEFENLMAQAFTRVLNDGREVAKTELGTAAIDTVLVSARVSGLAAEDRPVLSPVGLNIRRITGNFELTFCTRPIFEAWQRVWASSDNFFFTEPSRARSRAIRHSDALADHMLVIGERNSIVLPNLDVRNEKILGWSFGMFLAEVADLWGISVDSARSVYNAFAEDRVSPRVARVITQAIQDILPELAQELRKLKIQGEFCIESPISLSAVLPFSDRAVRFKEVDPAAVTAAAGFNLTEDQDKNLAFRYLAPLIEFYYDTGDWGINHWLKQRVHWLMPNPAGRVSSSSIAAHHAYF